MVVDDVTVDNNIMTDGEIDVSPDAACAFPKLVVGFLGGKCCWDCCCLLVAHEHRCYLAVGFGFR
eukprot:2865974-Amphidinium_carterae.1